MKKKRKKIEKENKGNKEKNPNLMEEGTHVAKHKAEIGSLEAQAVFIGLGLEFTACSAAAKGCSPRFLLADLVIKQPIKSGTPRRGFHFFQLSPICALWPAASSARAALVFPVPGEIWEHSLGSH